MSKDSALLSLDSADDTADALVAIGNRVRELRRQKGLTLQALSALTGISTSMLSLVERAKSSASIGTLIVISSALDVHMSELLTKDIPRKRGRVTPKAQQPVHETALGVLRRILSEDHGRGIELAINEYRPGTGNSDTPVHHAGYEYGVLLEGELTVEVDGTAYLLRPGDVISYESTSPHRLWNHGKRRAQALWVNLDRSDGR